MTFKTKIEEEESDSVPDAKRQKLDLEPASSAELPVEFLYCQKFLTTTDANPKPPLPPSLATMAPEGKIRNNHEKLRRVLDNHGLRTSSISTPRAAISIYKDSFLEPELTEGDSYEQGREFLQTMFGLHPQQEQLEQVYATSIKRVYCLMLFCHQIREVCKGAMQDVGVSDLVAGCELQCRSLGKMTTSDFTSSQILSHARTLSASVPRLVASLIQRITKAESRNRVEQLEREFDRISLRNSTLSNALATIFITEHQCAIKEIVFKRSHQAKYERITIYLYDPDHDYHKPPRFLFLPGLNAALTKGPEALVNKMIDSFWAHLLRYGYFATLEMKECFNSDLKEFFSSGLTPNPHVPLLLNAHFSPSRPLSFYLYGKAGAGKSSFVRNFQPALEATIDETADPEILARFVKQNLNKRFDVLELELELRPNNNDLSVMSIIQGRRMTMAQSKPGLVVIDFEEMLSNNANANPNQLQVAQLISQRFSGRNGNYQKQKTAAPRNSEKRSIANDTSLVTLFTSNYDLDPSSEEALKRLKMFETLKAVELTAVSGSDRENFAHSYITQCIKDRFSDLNPQCKIKLDIAFGSGDTRPLVRSLRMIAFYICAQFTESLQVGGTVEAEVRQNDTGCTITVGTESISLTVGSMENLFPQVPRVYDTRVGDAMESLQSITARRDELSVVLDFWLAKTLAPTVILSNDKAKIKSLASCFSDMKDVFCIENVNADTYKMMKSLYDPNDTPNLRDDILRYGRGANVVVEIDCPTENAQMSIREIIEDSPSMTAFSTAKSALHKEGILFCVFVEGEITPEVRSRASIIL